MAQRRRDNQSKGYDLLNFKGQFCPFVFFLSVPYDL